MGILHIMKSFRGSSEFAISLMRHAGQNGPVMRQLWSDGLILVQSWNDTRSKAT